MARQIIINADDFGLSASVNEGIARAFLQGIVTSVSLLCGGRAFDDAVRTIRRHEMRHVGVHLALDEELPVLASHCIPALVSRDGALLPRHRVLWRSVLHRADFLEQAEWELDAQIGKALAAGISPTHLDGHGHIQVFPGIVDIVLRLARRYRIPQVRFPLEPIAIIPPGCRPRSLLYKGIVSLLAHGCRKKFRESGVSFPRFFGTSAAGHLSPESLKAFLSRAREGEVTLIMVHPGLSDSSTRSTYCRWRYEWEAELGVLTRQTKKQCEALENIRLVSFG